MMPEYLFESLQNNDANTVSFNSHNNSDYGINDLGLPLEFALLFEDVFATSKQNIQNPSPEQFLPMTNAQFHFGNQQNNYFDNNRFNGYSSNDLNYHKRVNNASNDQLGFQQSLRIPLPFHADSNQEMSFHCVPDLESVFSESTTNTPVLQNANFQFTEQFETPSSSGFQNEYNFKVKKIKKNNPAPSKKHKRKNIMARSRTGCWICRIKHLKCDESRPCCNNCSRFGIQCDFSETRPAYVLDSNLRREKLDSITTKKKRRASD